MLNQTPSALHERSCKCTVHQHSSAVVMAFARSLRQLTPTLVTQLLPSSTQLSVGCGLHQQLPSAFLSLANLHTATQWHHTLLPWQQTHERHPPSNGAGYQGYYAHHCRNKTVNLHKDVRLYSSSGSEEADKPQYPIRTPDHVYVYNGPLAVTVSRLKKLSLFSCACTIAASPVIIYMSSASSFGAKASIALTLCGFGFFTTGLMHWFTSPYVHWLTYNSNTGLAEVETLSLFAKHQRRTFSESEVQYPNTLRPQATFQVHGQVYYLDADNFQDKELLSKLTPKDQSPAEKPQSQ